MLEKTLVEEAISRALAQDGYHLYSLRLYKKRGDLILAVEIDESLNLEQITAVSEKISAVLDEVDKSDEHYILDVSSAGIERAIVLDDIDKALGSYIHVETDNKEVYEGDLREVKDEDIVLKIKVKNLNKEITIAKKAIKKLRYAVKF